MKEKRQRRLKILEKRFLRLSREPSPKYPTVMQLARMNNVSTPTIYRDLEYLRLKLGNFTIPSNIPLGGKKYGKV